MPMLNPRLYQHRYESENHGLAPSDSLESFNIGFNQRQQTKVPWFFVATAKGELSISGQRNELYLGRGTDSAKIDLVTES